MGLFDGTPLERPVADDSPDGDSPEGDGASGGPAPGDQHPRVRRERRRGNWCAVVGGLDGDAAELKRLLKTLREGLGAGGGVSDGEIVLQGDHRDAVVKRLVELGYHAKPSGG